MLRWGKAQKSDQENQFGFTLIEFAIVMIISGLALAAMLEAYKIYLIDKKIRETYEKHNIISTTFSGFLSARGRYPCPSDPTLPLTDPDAGIEGIPGPDPDRCVNLANALSTPGECTGPGNTGICLVEGARATDGPFIGNTDLDPVYIGGIPYRTLKTGIEEELCYDIATGDSVPCNPSDPTQYNPTEATFQSVALNDILDPWGFQMSYAVSATQTDSARFDSNYGALGIETEGGISLLKPAGSGHFVIISHGNNHMGAYSQQGRIEHPCVAGTAEAENCDLDGTFVSGLRSEGNNANYFDDIVMYRAYTLSELWSFGPSPDEDELIMFSALPGNIGVGVSDPQVKLHINGALRAANVRADVICDSVETGNCFSPSHLAGEGMHCDEAPPGFFKVATGVAHAALICEDVPNYTGYEGQECPFGKYVKGFLPGGVLKCGDPPN